MNKFSMLKAGTAPIAIGLAMVASAAQAQAVADENATLPAEETAAPAIVVTGSRITNPNLVQSAPVNVVGESEISLRQATNAEELVGELPGVSPGLNSSVNNGSAGYASLNLRNLGQNRNLVLLDGTRIVPSSTDGTTDLNVLPVALIERVEIVTGGASSVYGADAISGVANFITKRDFAGFDSQTSFGITEQGDGQRFRQDVTLGANFDDGRGNAVLSLGYQKVDSVLQGDRKLSANTLFIDGSSVGSGTSIPTRITSVRAGATNAATNQYNPATGTLVATYNTFNFAPYNYFQTPLERFNVFGAANYEVAPAIEFYTKGMYTKSTVSLQLAPSGLFGDTWQFPLSNPFITSTIRNQICAARNINAATCAAAGAATGPSDPNYREVPVTINRRLVEMGARQAEYVTNQFQVWTGFRGDLTDTISYDVYGTYGESERTRTYLNWGLKSRVQQGLRATSTTTCSDPSNGCVPINLFGPAPGTNISQDAVNFFNQPTFLITKTDLAVVNASISGDLGTSGFLFAETPIGFAIGGEYRRTRASQIADVASGTQDEVLGTGAPQPSFSGGYNVREVFGELIVPIVEDAPFFNSLTLEAGARYSDYSNTGTSFTWKAGGSWEPAPGFKLRGIYQKAVRSPSISELFDPVVTGLTALAVDPCAGTNPVGNATLTAICIAQGAPANTIGNIPVPSAAQINQTSGGNPNLDVESARSYTFGVVLTPPSIPGLAFTADYYNIKLTDAITFPTPGDILDPCFVNNDASACALIVRNPLNGSLNGGGDTPGLLLQQTNQGTIKTSGVDARLTFGTDVGFGRVAFDLTGNWVDKWTFQAGPNSIVRDCVGYYGENCEPIIPEYSFNLRSTVTLGDNVDLSLLWSWISGTELEPLSGAFGDALPEYSKIPAYSWFDLTTRFRVNENFDFTATVYNLLDKDAPNVSSYVGSSSYNSGNTYPTTYDALGRRYQVTAHVRF